MKSLRSRRHLALCNALIDARKSANLSQQGLASKVKTSQTVIARIELGDRRVDVVEFLDLAKALGLDPHKVIDDLIG